MIHAKMQFKISPLLKCKILNCLIINISIIFNSIENVGIIYFYYTEIFFYVSKNILLTFLHVKILFEKDVLYILL